ncbi:MAG TPA: hypothetical protein VG347_01390 [Verrucomicrobiae bacterium]|nr:hypothetical protein [Verrucomicrobiae bacterium]
MTPPLQKTDPPKVFAMWLAALFLTVLGAKLWIVQLYGSPLPLWDQWYEAKGFFRAWAEGHLPWQAFFEPDNGHRILANRVLDVTLIELNGRWEPLMQMTANVCIHATFAGGLAFCLWHFLGRKNGGLFCVLVAPFYALPYAGENAIWAITLEYFLDAFSLATLVLLGFARPGSRWWWAGVAVAVLGLFTMATGLLAPMTVAGLTVLRLIKEWRLKKNKWNLITLGVCAGITVLGASLNSVTEDKSLQAHALKEFLPAFFRNLTWVFYDSPVAGFFVLLLPLLLLLIVYFRRNFAESRAAELLLTMGLWGILQAAALGYGRANYGDGYPTSRYLDILNIAVIAALFAVLLLARFWLRGPFFTRFTLLAPVIFSAVIFCALARISETVVDGLLQPTRTMNLVAEERVERFLSTGNQSELFEKPTVRPEPKVALEVLTNASLQVILPACCLPPATPQVAGRFSFVSNWLLNNATTLLYGGLVLFLALVGRQLVRSPAGLAWENLPAFIALLALLAALGFVWSRSVNTRRTMEYSLQTQLVGYFQANNNPQRAAIHAAKAEALKNDAGRLRP